MLLCVVSASRVHVSRTFAGERCNSVMIVVMSAAMHRGKVAERGKLTRELRLERESQATGTWDISTCCCHLFDLLRRHAPWSVELSRLLVG